jgi:hypothetical protein
VATRIVLPLQVVLEGGGDRDRREARLERLQHLEVVAHVHVGLAGHHELHAVHLRPAHADRDVEAVLPIEACRERLVKAAVLGLRVPAREESDFVLCRHTGCE